MRRNSWGVKTLKNPGGGAPGVRTSLGQLLRLDGGLDLLRQVRCHLPDVVLLLRMLSDLPHHFVVVCSGGYKGATGHHVGTTQFLEHWHSVLLVSWNISHRGTVAGTVRFRVTLGTVSPWHVPPTPGPRSQVAPGHQLRAVRGRVTRASGLPRSPVARDRSGNVYTSCASDPTLPRPCDPRSAQGARQAPRPHRVGAGARRPRAGVRVHTDRRTPRHVKRYCGVMARSGGPRRRRRVREAPAARYPTGAQPELTGIVLDSDVIIEILRGAR